MESQIVAGISFTENFVDHKMIYWEFFTFVFSKQRVKFLPGNVFTVFGSHFISFHWANNCFCCPETFLKQTELQLLSVSKMPPSLFWQFLSCVQVRPQSRHGPVQVWTSRRQHLSASPHDWSAQIPKCCHRGTRSFCWIRRGHQELRGDQH